MHLYFNGLQRGDLSDARSWFLDKCSLVFPVGKDCIEKMSVEG